VGKEEFVKMALKDWKRAKTGRGLLLWEKGKHFIYIDSQLSNMGKVFVVESNTIHNINISFKFKTKSAALKFARAYMRKH